MLSTVSTDSSQTEETERNIVFSPSISATPRSHLLDFKEKKFLKKHGLQVTSFHKAERPTFLQTLLYIFTQKPYNRKQCRQLQMSANPITPQ